MEDNKGHNPLLGIFELALFMKAGVERFPTDKDTAIRSFAVPVVLLFLWVYPLYKVPTEILGPREYGELILIHGSVLAVTISMLCTILWFIAKHLGKTEYYWSVITMNNYCAVVGFVFMLPLFIMVLTGYHSWEEVFHALILISFYELALTAYVFTRGLRVPWQFGTGVAFLGMFIWDGTSTTIFALAGVS